MNKKEERNKKIIEEEVCEACADHVCDDNCGCELSEAAKESLKRDRTK